MNPGRDDGEADAMLMRRVGAGDGAAYRLLMDRHLTPLLGFCHRVLSDRAEAEDVVQDAFLRLWQNAGRWQPKARLATWLHRVAYNLCVDRLRRRRSVPLDAIADPPDPRTDATADIQRAQLIRTVERSLASLPERQRVAVALVHYQEIGNVEAADILGVSVEAVESLLARARRSLRRDLAGRRPDLMGDP